MAQLSADEVRYVALLANLKLTDAEVELYRSQLTDIFSHFQSLQELNTEGVEITGHATDVNTVLRADEPAAPLDREQVLQSAPVRDGEFIRVRPVLE